MLIRVARPCRERWSEMAGDDRTRHCARCAKDVHDLSAMTVEEIRALQASGTPWCGRLYRRADGTVVTAECRDRPPALGAAVGVSLALASAACSVICLPFRHHESTPVAVAPDTAPAPVPAPTSVDPRTIVDLTDDDPSLYMMGDISDPELDFHDQGTDPNAPAAPIDPTEPTDL